MEDLRKVLKLYSKIVKDLKDKGFIYLEDYVKNTREKQVILDLLKARFNERIKHSIVGGKTKVWITEAIEEPISFKDVMLIHEAALAFGGEKGIISEGLADVALYDAWFESRGDPVKYAALAYYNLILNHPFVNGNKRTATITADSILYIYDYELVASAEELVDLALKVADGKVDKAYVVKWFKKHSKKIRSRNTPMPIKLPKDPEERRKVLEKIIKEIVRKRKKVLEELAKY